MTVVIAERQMRGTVHDRDCPRFAPQPDALAPYIEDEMRVVDQLKADGVMTAAYHRAAGPGAISSAKDPARDALRERVDTLPCEI